MSQNHSQNLVEKHAFKSSGILQRFAYPTFDYNSEKQNAFLLLPNGICLKQ